MVKNTSSITLFRFYPKGKHKVSLIWSVKEEKCKGKHPQKMVRFAIFLLEYTRNVFTCAIHRVK